MNAKTQWMVVVGAVSVLTGGALLATNLLKDELTTVGVGADAPGFAAKTLDEPARMKTLTDYRGKVLLLNIWATYCIPCRTEKPTVGVGAMPRSCTEQPAPSRPAIAACRSISPLGRPSRETSTLPPRANAPNAAANRAAASAVSPFPTTPRMPDTETIRSAGADMRVLGSGRARRGDCTKPGSPRVADARMKLHSGRRRLDRLEAIAVHYAASSMMRYRWE